MERSSSRSPPFLSRRWSPPRSPRVSECARLVTAHSARRLVAALRAKHLLLVLDNLEHLLEATPLIAQLLVACPKLSVLATSRAVLRISGEQDCPVPPLALPDAETAPTVEEVSAAPAVQLFVARAQAARPDFVLTAGKRQRRRRYLPAAGWVAPGDRAGGGAHQASTRAGAAPSSRASAADTHRRATGSTGPPASDARRDRLELRPADRR